MRTASLLTEMTVSEEVRRELAEFARGTHQYSVITTRASVVGHREVEVEFYCDYDDRDELTQDFEELVRSHEKALEDFETIQREECCDGEVCCLEVECFDAGFLSVHSVVVVGL